MRSSRLGFTLVELLIVIVVIAILALIATVAYSGITNRAYYNRAQSELSSLANAVHLYKVDHEEYPEDVPRNIPAEITKYLNSSADRWPTAPWPKSVYDYDYFIGSDGEEVSQISIRFCPADGLISDCHFPREAWAKDFSVNSSAYWCITGKCRAHPSEPDDYPAYCINCKN